jgi:hypothetical protein
MTGIFSMQNICTSCSSFCTTFLLRKLRDYYLPKLLLFLEPTHLQVKLAHFSTAGKIHEPFMPIIFAKMANFAAPCFYTICV